MTAQEGRRVRSWLLRRLTNQTRVSTLMSYVNWRLISLAQPHVNSNAGSRLSPVNLARPQTHAQTSDDANYNNRGATGKQSDFSCTRVLAGSPGAFMLIKVRF